ncbi:hypothetical protein SAMN05661080_01447 [Modestobacter sp. DSM 44400]|nr:hypothetical protein SAMN05661080_01447 [Modestobacter sp. DSM 44400]
MAIGTQIGFALGGFSPAIAAGIVGDGPSGWLPVAFLTAGAATVAGPTATRPRGRRLPGPGQLVSMPPSTGSVAPVTYPPASLARNTSAAASSIGSPIRPTSTRGNCDSR